jgi:hypothetical protein
MVRERVLNERTGFNFFFSFEQVLVRDHEMSTYHTPLVGMSLSAVNPSALASRSVSDAGSAVLVPCIVSRTTNRCSTYLAA